jgi:hypothetical protein
MTIGFNIWYPFGHCLRDLASMTNRNSFQDRSGPVRPKIGMRSIGLAPISANHLLSSSAIRFSIRLGLAFIPHQNGSLLGFVDRGKVDIRLVLHPKIK